MLYWLPADALVVAAEPQRHAGRAAVRQTGGCRGGQWSHARHALPPGGIRSPGAGHDARPQVLDGKGTDPAVNTTPTPTPTAVVTVPVAILHALSRAIGGWTAAVYPGTTTHLEVASRDPAARRPHTWHAVACLSNGVRLRFTLLVQDDGVACVTRHARLADGHADADAHADTDLQADVQANRDRAHRRRMASPAARTGTPAPRTERPGAGGGH